MSRFREGSESAHLASGENERDDHPLQEMNDILGPADLLQLRRMLRLPDTGRRSLASSACNCGRVQKARCECLGRLSEWSASNLRHAARSSRARAQAHRVDSIDSAEPVPLGNACAKPRRRREHRGGSLNSLTRIRSTPRIHLAHLESGRLVDQGRAPFIVSRPI